MLEWKNLFLGLKVSYLHASVVFCDCVLFRLTNTHFAGHSNRYFLNDVVPILDFHFSNKLKSVVAVDDDGSLIMYSME